MSKAVARNNNHLYLALGFIVILLGTGFYLGINGRELLRQKQPVPTETPKKVSQGPVTLTGRVTCLPGKGGIQTLACAQGFMSEDGEYYTIVVPSLENESEWFNSPLYTAEKVKVVGSVSEETSEQFDVAGKLTIDSFTVLGQTDEDADED